jgi:hypothetical protein
VCVALPGLKHRPDFTIITFLEIRLKQKEKEKSEIKGNQERKENYKEKNCRSRREIVNKK